MSKFLVFWVFDISAPFPFNDYRNRADRGDFGSLFAKGLKACQAAGPSKRHTKRPTQDANPLPALLLAFFFQSKESVTRALLLPAVIRLFFIQQYEHTSPIFDPQFLQKLDPWTIAAPQAPQ